MAVLPTLSLCTTKLYEPRRSAYSCHLETFYIFSRYDCHNEMQGFYYYIEYILSYYILSPNLLLLYHSEETFSPFTSLWGGPISVDFCSFRLL